MVFATTLIVLAPFLSSLVAPAAGRYLLCNSATHYLMQDASTGGLAPGSQGSGAARLGNPIVGAPYDPTAVQSQSWLLESAGQGEIQFINVRGRGDDVRGRGEDVGGRGEDGFRVGAHVDGLEGKGLNAQKAGFGSAVAYVRPYGDGNGPYGEEKEVHSFIFPSTKPTLAITSSKDANEPLTLEVYNETNALQHWVIYSLPEHEGDVAPATIQELEVVSLEDAVAGSQNV